MAHESGGKAEELKKLREELLKAHSPAEIRKLQVEIDELEGKRHPENDHDHDQNGDHEHTQ